MSMSSGDGGGQDFDLNLAPIIDCFTVLITYMLVSASFLSIGVLEVGVAASGNGDAKALVATEALPTLIIEVKKGNILGLKLTGGAKNVKEERMTSAVRGNQFDTSALAVFLDKSKRDFPALNEAVVQVDKGVEYRDLIKVVELLKKGIAKVYLGAGT